jgi:hypothetical protein
MDAELSTLRGRLKYLRETVLRNISYDDLAGRIMRGGKFAKANRKRTPTYTTLAAILRSGGVASRQPTG